MSTTDDNTIALVTNDFLLDDIEDMPAFLTLPSGAYHVKLEEGIVEKKIPMQGEDVDCFEAAMTVVETLEMTDKLGEDEKTPKQGDIASMLYNRTNKFGMGNFKDFVRPIAERFGVRTVGEIVSNSKGVELMIIVKRTYNKDRDRHNMQIKKVALI